MNTLQWYMMGLRSVQPANTFIGGVSATISTPALLATKLGILESRITNFTIVGSDIQCRITGSYSVTNNSFINNIFLTYFRDGDDLMLDYDTFYGCSNFKEELNLKGVANTYRSQSLDYSGIKKISLENLVSVFANCFQGTNSFNPIRAFLPKAVLATSTTCFRDYKRGSIITINPAMATANGGAEHPALITARNNGCIIRYATDLINKPNPVTSVIIGTIYSTSVQVSFTTPSINVNALDGFGLYKDGFFVKEFFSGDYIHNLSASTSYSNYSIISRDIMNNESTPVSLSFTTNTTANALLDGLVHNFGLNEEMGKIAFNSYGFYDLSNTGLTVNESGKLGKAYLATATGQFLKNINAPTITGNFTINVWCYRTANPAATHAGIVNYGNYGEGGFGLWMNTVGDLAYRINNSFAYNSAANIPLNTWTMVSLVYNGSTVKVYVNAVEKTSVSFTTNPTTITDLNMFTGYVGSTFIGKLDSPLIYNTAKIASEITSLYNSGNGIKL